MIVIALHEVMTIPDSLPSSQASAFGRQIRILPALLLSLCFVSGGFGASSNVAVVRVDVTPGHSINSFDPDKALGSSIDVLSKSGIDKVYTPHIIEESLSAGWGPISYRNNSELRMAAWHWTENGTWSDEANKSGYFTGSSELKEPIRYILQYALPHRGFSTSGDRPVPGPDLSYWKSNPYLTSKFTGESDALHPQWVILDMKSEKAVNAVRIAWKSPFARSYQVEYWVGTDALDFDKGPAGEWKTFPNGKMQQAKGGAVVLKLGDEPVQTRFVRIWMTESSNTCNEHGSDDVRNCVGYAIEEFKAGALDANNTFTDVTGDGTERNGPEWVSSSIDPWHSAADASANGGGQHTGFDLFFTSGLTNNLPAMIPVTMLYGTPDDAAAEVAYVERRGYPVSLCGVGRRARWQACHSRRLWGAAFAVGREAIHKVDPKLRLGGPIFEGVNEDIRVWPDAQGKTSWMGRFVAYLKAHGRLSDLAFVSFEHYPMSRCQTTWKDLYREPELMKHILEVWRGDGVPKTVPLMVTESSVAAGLTGPMSQIFGGLWLADSIGAFFEGGGAAYYHSPIQPQTTENTCEGAASWSNFIADRDYNISGYTAFYWAAHMLNLEWVAHRSGVHQMYPSTVSIRDGDGNSLVTSYAMHRPDGIWSLMLVNRDESDSHTVRVVFEDSMRTVKREFAGQVTLVTFGSEQYSWKDNGAKSDADPDGPPVGRIARSADRLRPMSFPRHRSPFCVGGTKSVVLD